MLEFALLGASDVSFNLFLLPNALVERSRCFWRGRQQYIYIYIYIEEAQIPSPRDKLRELKLKVQDLRRCDVLKRKTTVNGGHHFLLL